MEKWYGYRHINGTTHVKRYSNYSDILEVVESTFVEAISQVFEAKDRDDAMIKAKEYLNNTT